MLRRRGRARIRRGAAALAILLVACGREGEPAAAPDAAPAPEAVQAPPAAPSEPLPPAEGPDSEVPGRWRKLRPARFDPALDAEQRAEIARLEAIGYAAGSSPAPERRGVSIHDRARAWPGWNLYTSGHAPEAVLMDMDGRVLHRWRHRFRDVWPDFPKVWLNTGAGFFRRAHLFPNGDLLAIYEGLGLVKLDRDSRLLWASPIQAHHDLDVAPDGDLYVLAREGRLVPEVDPEHPVLIDFVAQLAPDGSERRRVSLLDALRRSPHARLIDPARIRMGDVFHTNSISLLDGRLAGRLPEFRRGSALVSLLIPSAIAVLDLERGEVAWALQGGFRSQHDPTLLPDGRILLFDNRGAYPWSRVLELDAASGQVAWSYTGSPERPFYSQACGAVERLPNGNTLVSESDAGRAFELAPDGAIVWEYHNPHRAGERDELIATLFEMVRLPADFPIGWARGGDAERAVPPPASTPPAGGPAPRAAPRAGSRDRARSGTGRAARPRARGRSRRGERCLAPAAATGRRHAPRSAPACRSRAAASACSPRSAASRGVVPSIARAPGSAPRARSSSTTPACPAWAAR